MLLQFPNFKKLTIHDLELIKGKTSSFLPYSDFNFVSLFCWNNNSTTEISILNDNLVIKLKDYTSSSFNYSFIGNNKPIDTAHKLLKELQKQNVDKLQLVPKSNFDSLTQPGLILSGTADQNDYILEVIKIAKMEGSEFHKKRNLYKKFEKENIAFLRILRLDDENFLNESIKLFYKWAKLKNKAEDEYCDELDAFKRLPQLVDLNLHAASLFINNILEGFAIVEIINNDYCMIHFEKTNPELTGISEYLIREVSKSLADKGIRYINYQQDLGLEGLKKSKLSYRPVKFLEKCEIRLTN